MKKSSEKKILGFFLLFLTALIWGVAFVAQSVGMDHIGPYTFNTGRLLLGAAVTMPWAIMELKKQKNVEEEKKRVLALTEENKKLQREIEKTRQELEEYLKVLNAE